MKKIYGLLIMTFLLTTGAFGETDIDKIVSNIKKDFEVVDSNKNLKIENTLKTGTYTTYDFIQNNNIKVATLGTYENNTETYEKYYLKDDKISYIFTEKIKYSFDNNNKNTMKIEKEEHKYYFDDSQKLVRYIAPDNKTYDADKIPNEAFIKVESLKKNMKTHLKLSSSKEIIMEEMRKEFEEANRQMTRKMEEMRKEMDNFFNKF
ncbi:hypothetical protein [Fusobacterium russii]|uniref:hypothetical protein n=1 Tax=Fusobacterium russii TaxID=854 RepID=UPI00039CA32F|nr:hypothetical protein [Fusobacterium russii]